MSFSEINALRKRGELQEAYEMAYEELSQNPQDAWIKRALMWVLYDLMKNREDISDLLGEIASLEINPDEEKLFFDNVVWIIAKNVASVQNNPGYVNSIFEKISGLHFSASNGYSYLMKAFHKHRGVWDRYAQFCDWWGLKNFTQEDYKPFKTDDGKEVMALAEQVYIAYSRALLQSTDSDKIREFIPELESLGNRYPNYKYPPYFIAKLYQKIEDFDNARRILLPFVRNKSNDYWVWQTLGDVCQDEDLKFSCYSKALTCRCKAEMLVSVKEAYAHMLVSRGMYNEAKTEISRVLEIRQSNSWKIPNSLKQYELSGWYGSASALANNNNCYNTHKAAAEELMLDDLIHVPIILVGINKEKKIANFITPEQKKGMFIYSRVLKGLPEPGNCYEAYFSEYKDDGFAKAVRLIPSRNSVWKNLVKDFSGRLKIGPNKGFGIVETSETQVFIPKFLLNGLNENNMVSGKAVVSYDSKKKRNGLSAFACHLTRPE